MKNYSLLFSVLLLSGCFGTGGGGSVAPVTPIKCTSDGIGNIYAGIEAAAFRLKYQSGQAVSIAIMGDSTTVGDGANGSANWTAGSPFYLEVDTYPTQAQQDNIAIPSSTRLLRTFIESKNPASKVYNFGKAGAEASWHITHGTVAQIAALNVQVVFIALGINTGKQGHSQHGDMEILIQQTLTAGMIPVLVKENNINYPYWACTRNDINTQATAHNLDAVDLGTPDGIINPVLMTDALHPNAAGYQIIFDQYRTWLEK